MKKQIIWTALALSVVLTACGEKPAGESPEIPNSTPVPVVTAHVTAVPSAPASPAPTPEHTHTPEPVAPSAPEPTPEPIPTPPAVKPPVPPAKTAAPEPTPCESLCGLPLAPTPEPAETPEPAVSDIPMPEQSVEPTPEPTLTPMPEPSPEAPRPGDEEVLAAYRQACEAYGWFDVTTLPLDYSVTVMVGESPYYRVSDERFPSLDALRGYLKTLFSDEVVDALLPIDGTHYLDIDGVLHAADAGRGTDTGKGGETVEVLWESEEAATSCVVRVTVDLLGEDLVTVTGTEVYDFPYQKVGDKWVFTDFTSII